MTLAGHVKAGLREIAAYKLRSFLTFLGVAVGTASVLSMSGILNGWKNMAETQLRSSGPGRLIVLNDRERPSPGSRGLRLEDAVALREAVPSLRLVSPVNAVVLRSYFEGRGLRLGVSGVTTQFRSLDWRYRLRGRFITDSDERLSSKVCVLVRPLKKTGYWSEKDPLDPVFESGDPLGATLVLGVTAFKVVGVLEEVPQERLVDLSFGESNVLVPLSSFQDRLLPDVPLQRIDIDVGSPRTALAERRIRNILTRRHGGASDFEIKNLAAILQGTMRSVETTGFVLAAIAAIALFTGGVGIMNITLASVSTRIREIGIRKALGAGQMDILVQFLVEAGLLSAGGGIVGCFLGLSLCRVGRRYLEAWGYPPPAHLAAALLMALAVGLVFALYPAWRAARTAPAACLRAD